MAMLIGTYEKGFNGNTLLQALNKVRFGSLPSYSEFSSLEDARSRLGVTYVSTIANIIATEVSRQIRINCTAGIPMTRIYAHARSKMDLNTGFAQGLHKLFTQSSFTVKFNLYHDTNNKLGLSSEFTYTFNNNNTSPNPDTDLNIRRDYIPAGRYNRPGRPNTIEFITVHNTANSDRGANARLHASFVKNASTKVSWHYTVDDGNVIYQHLPENEIGYHAGDSQGNSKSIGIEICENSDGNFERAVQNAQKLIRHLMNKHNLSLSRVVTHQHWSGKNCPRLLLGRWDSFIRGITNSNVPLPEGPPVYDGGSTTTLRPGSSGSAVRQLQQDLISVGESLPSGADGSYGPQTESAVRSFQSKNGLQVDGIAGPATLRKLQESTNGGSSGGSTGTLRRGDTGAAVRQLQTNLISAGEFLASGVDGNFGPDTERAVRSFQGRHSLQVDGVAGPATQAKIREIIGGNGAASDILRPGDSGSSVRQLQQDLITAGENLVYGADGSYGPDTERAVRSFQRKKGLQVDGIAGPLTQAELRQSIGGGGSSSVLRPGDSGAAVRQLQRDLMSAGQTLTYGADGSYGAETERAVRAFQSRYNLQVDGVAGPGTLGKLQEILGGGSGTSVIRPGDSGAAVRKLQTDLISAGESLPSGADGSYGPQTERAVRSFQSKNGLSADGVAGPLTQTKLNEVIGGSTSRTLRLGDSGSLVRELQRNLISAGGSLPSGADGNFGNETERAVRAFQSSNGLQVDGIAGPATQSKLRQVVSGGGNSTTLRRGDTGVAVRQLQRDLLSAGESIPSGIDGNYGPQTEQAVRDFQRRYGLQIDGVAGPATQSRLRAVLK